MPIGIRTPKSRIKAADRDEYYKSFRKKVFKLIKMGYDRLNSKKYKDSEEPDITGELAKEMKAAIQDRAAPRWAWHFSIHDDPHINEPGRLGKARRRLDIEIERTCHGQHPCYPFEAKRLSGDSFTTGKYFGENGLGEFISGHYAPDESEAGMLGYMQSDNPENWAAKLDCKLKKDRVSMQVYSGGEWMHVQIISELNHCYCSKHNRPSIGRPIAIYHLLLDFC